MIFENLLKRTHLLIAAARPRSWQTPRPARKRWDAFTLLELLVAITILSLMSVFMFTVLSQTISTWEIGNRRIEAAQAARVGLNSIAKDLQFAFSGSFITTNFSGAPVTSIVPFVATTNATTTATISGLPNIVAVTGSDQVFAIVSHGEDLSSSVPNSFHEIGYLCVFVQSTAGNVSVPGQSYTLFKHKVENIPAFDAFLRNTPSTNWVNAASGDWITHRQPIIDNCIRFKLSYLTAAGSLTNSWSSQTTLPKAVLAEVTVVDSKTMAKIRREKGSTQLTPAEIQGITNSATGTVPRLLRQGAVVMRRLIPLPNSQ